MQRSLLELAEAIPLMNGGFARDTIRAEPKRQQIKPREVKVHDYGFFLDLLTINYYIKSIIVCVGDMMKSFLHFHHHLDVVVMEVVVVQVHAINLVGKKGVGELVKE